MKHLLLALLVLSASFAIAKNNNKHFKESCRGQVLDANTGQPIEYVSIGIEKASIATVSNDDGSFAFAVGKQYDKDTIRFSSIGYENFRIPVSEFKGLGELSVKLVPRDIELKQIEINSINVKARTLGNTYSNTKLNAGFHSNRKGHEIGVLLKINKPTFLQELNINLVKCTYNKLFYRLNIYRELEEGKYENILQEPIYIDQQITESTPTISVSLSQYNIVVDSNTLVSIEHVKSMGDGWLTFSANQNFARGATCYYRTTNFGEWEKSPYKFGFSVKVKEQKD